MGFLYAQKALQKPYKTLPCNYCTILYIKALQLFIISPLLHFNLLLTKFIKMYFLPKNKYLALLVFMLIIVVAVVVATSILKLKPDAKNPVNYRFTLGSKKPSVKA